MWLGRACAGKGGKGDRVNPIPIQVLTDVRPMGRRILSPLLASLGEVLWCLFGYRGWPGVALDAIWLLTVCVFGLCFVRPRF